MILYKDRREIGERGKGRGRDGEEREEKSLGLNLIRLYYFCWKCYEDGVG